jgi:hypothetical protein
MQIRQVYTATGHQGHASRTRLSKQHFKHSKVDGSKLQTVTEDLAAADEILVIPAFGG